MKNDEMKKKLEVDELKCKLCDQTFVKSFELERHVKSSHETYQEYECQICEKKFVTKWRLKKHKLLHSGRVKSHCRYFRNNVTCPYDELGCKFLHHRSNQCDTYELFEDTIVENYDEENSSDIKSRSDTKEETLFYT